MELSNGVLRLSFDERTGSLIQVEDLRHGFKHLADPNAGKLFRVAVPDEEHWIGRYCDSRNSDPPQMRVTDGQAIIHYPDLKLPNGTGAGIEVTVRVSLPSGADEAKFTIELTNHSPRLIHEVCFPQVGGWRGYAGSGQDKVTLGNCTTLDPHSLRHSGLGGGGFTLLGEFRKRNYAFPVGMVFPMFDISGGGRGLSYIHYPAQIRRCELVLEDENKFLGECQCAWSWVHRPFLGCGQKWTSDPIGIAPHTGDWHATADRMRTWLQTWWRAPQSPANLRGEIGHFHLQFQDFEGMERNALSTAPQIARYCRDHGINHLCLWDMRMLGMYCRAGTGGVLEYPPERQQELQRVLREIRGLGMQVSGLINLRLITQKNKLWPKLGEKWMVRSLYGAPASKESYPIRSSHGSFFSSFLEEGGTQLCQSNPAWQQWALAKVEQAADMGFTSLFLDQPFDAHLCFSREHGHEVPSHAHEGACAWIAEAARRIRQRDPAACVIGENPDIWNSQHLDLWMNWGGCDLNMEIYRYTLPDSLQSWCIDAYEHQHQVARGFALGCQLMLYVRGLELALSTVPEFAQRIRRLATLRRQTESFTVQGRFIGAKDLTLDSDVPVVAHAYDTESKLGIILGEESQSASAGGAVKLKIHRAALSGVAPATVRLYRENGTSEELAVRATGEHLIIETRLNRWESAVLEIATSLVSANAMK